MCPPWCPRVPSVSYHPPCVRNVHLFQFVRARLQYLMFKDIYVWEGDCGATSGNRRKL